jgi:HK97 family phage major capsid protein
MPDRPSPGDLEQRNAPELEAPSLEGRRLRGRIPYGVESRDLGGWREIIDPGALRGAKLDSLVCTVDHGGVPLGRHPRTLDVEDRADGLHWSVELPESRSDVREAVERGDLCSGSWRMRVARDEWRGNTRHVLEIAELLDVSVVTSPAYSAAATEYRSTHQPPADERANHQEATVPEEQNEGGGLRVEDRAAEATPSTVESRVLAAIASVPPGECRDLTHATAAPVEPDDLRSQLIDKFREASVVAASGVPIVPTDKKAVKFPVLTGDVDVAFYDELEPIAESDPTLDDFEVPVKALKALVRMSTEAVEDSDPDLLRLVSDNLNLAMALKGDRELLVGNDAKGFPGLTQVTGTQSIAVGGALSWDHILRACGMLVESNVPGPYAVLLGARPSTALGMLKDGDDNYLVPPPGVPPIFQTGWFTVTGGASPTTTAIVYAPGQQMIVVRRQVTVEIDRSEEFSRDAILARGRYRLGLGVPHPQSIVKLTGIAAPAIA